MKHDAKETTQPEQALISKSALGCIFRLNIFSRNENPKRSRTEQHQSYYSKESKIEFPTLHIIGDTDQVIKREMSDDLVSDYFEEKVTVIARHPDGHILPTKGDCKATIVDFINKRHAEANA